MIRKNGIFKQMSIGVRIGLGFSVILSIFIVTSIFSLDMYKKSELSLTHYSTVSSDAISILDIDRQVSELQRVILAYSNTGNDKIITSAKKYHKKLINDLSSVRDPTDNKNSLQALESMKKILEKFGEDIDSLVEARKRRDTLVNESLVSLSSNLFNTIKNIETISKRDNDVKTLYLILSIHESSLTAQMNAISFLSNRKYSLQKAANTAFDSALDEAHKLYDFDSSSVQLRSLERTLIKNISDYANMFYRSVQATRDYLFLVNVVMTGKTSEFAILSHTLKMSTLSKLNRLTESTTTRSSEARTITFTVITSAIIIGCILAFITSRSLSQPIQEIARTFRHLVQGKHDTAIPGLSRGDEIGQLANAANVFKNMNEQTKKILTESQAISNELKLREHELEERTILLQKSNDELDNFAYIASHDLKSPLRAIDNLCKWVKEDCIDALPEESQEHLNKMQQRIYRMENLLSDLLNYSRVGRIDTIIDTVSVEKLAQDVVELIDKPESFIIHISDDLPEITTQASPLQQVFLNLFTNAIKYNDKENGCIKLTSQYLSNNFIEFSVSDNGPGIDPKFHQRIFQMFQTLQSRDVIESSGMGLAIIKKVIEVQGGEIRIESELGKGSVFIFSWPLSIRDNSEEVA